MGQQQKEAYVTGQIGVAVARLEKHAIDPAPLLNAMAGDATSITTLSLQLLARTHEYGAGRDAREQRRASKGRSRAADRDAPQSMGLVRGEGMLPPSVVGFLITLMIEACVRVGIAPPMALAQLVRAHLEADTFAAQELKAPDAFDRAVRYKDAYPEADQAEIARYAGVTRPLVSQWIKSGGLGSAVERLRRLVPRAADLFRDTTPRV